MKRILVLMLVAIAMLMFVSCENKAEEPVEDIDYTKLVGKWKATYENNNVNYISIEFKEGRIADLRDSTPTDGMSGYLNMLVTISGNTVTFTSKNDSSEKYSYTVEIDGYKMTLTLKGDKNLFKYHPDLKTITLSAMG